MTARTVACIQQALDGEIDRFRLSAEERDDLRQAESELDAVVNAIPVNPLPDLAPAVLARIRQADLSGNVRTSDVPPHAALPAWPQRILTWIWRPRAISFGWRPVYGLGAVAAAVSLVKSKVAEGEAKRVPPERIATAVEARVKSLVRASETLKRADVEIHSEGELLVSADALDAGVSESALIRIVRTPHPSGVRSPSRSWRTSFASVRRRSTRWRE